MFDPFIIALQAGDPTGVIMSLDDAVVLRAAVHDHPFEGVEAAGGILRLVLEVLHDIEVVDTIESVGRGVIMFRAQIADDPGIADGLLLVGSNDGGKLTELTVYLRPLASLQRLAEEIGKGLGAGRPDQDNP
ncbi:MAG: hypothetical protein ABIW84_06660 [Ilumatobacteraceae bacterium]